MAAPSVPPLTLWVVDDHLIFLDVLARALAAEPDMKIVATAGDGTAALAAWQRHRPALTLIDLRMLGMDGIRTLQQIRSLNAAARMLVFTTADHRHDAVAAIEAGAAGCLTKAMRYHDLLAAIRAVHAHGHLPWPAAVPRHNGPPGPGLSSREFEVLALLRDGLSQEEISQRLAIADRTVRVHIGTLKEKLAAASMAQCVARAYDLGILRS
jgi:DNA-binding NarL/FixJ family response regulator